MSMLSDTSHILESISSVDVLDHLLKNYRFKTEDLASACRKGTDPAIVKRLLQDKRIGLDFGRKVNFPLPETFSVMLIIYDKLNDQILTKDVVLKNACKNG